MPELNGRFSYLAGFGVTSIAAELPEGMTQWDVSAQTYAVFPCTLQMIHET